MDNPDIFHFSKKFLHKPEFRGYDLSSFYKRLEQNSKNPLPVEDCSFFTIETSQDYGVLPGKGGTHAVPGYETFLIDCFNKLNIEYINTGEKKHFDFIKEEYPMSSCMYPMLGKLKMWDFTYMWRLLGDYHYIKNNRDKLKKYFISLDQRDVLLVDSPNRSLEIFKSMDCRLLYNAEQFCVYFPMSIRKNPAVYDGLDGPWGRGYPAVKDLLTDYGEVKRFEREKYSDDALLVKGEKIRYLNGGPVIGEVDYYYYLLEKYHDFFAGLLNLDDQIMMHHLHYIHYPEIKIDNKCQIFRRVASTVEESVQLPDGSRDRILGRFL